MRMRGGRTDYGSGIALLHPFISRRPTFHCRDLLLLEAKRRKWQWISMAGLALIICNSVLAFWLSTTRAPVVFADTVLSSGALYQEGVFVRQPLDKEKSQQIITSHKHHNRITRHKSIKNNSRTEK